MDTNANANDIQSQVESLEARLKSIRAEVALINTQLEQLQLASKRQGQTPLNTRTLIEWALQQSDLKPTTNEYDGDGGIAQVTNTPAKVLQDVLLGLNVRIWMDYDHSEIMEVAQQQLYKGVDEPIYKMGVRRAAVQIMEMVDWGFPDTETLEEFVKEYCKS
jgi:hypothetical protein